MQHAVRIDPGSIFFVRIDPGNAVRVVVKCASYVANLEYGLLSMSEQEHDWWVDKCKGYSLDKFCDDMTSKVIWGPSQEIVVWGLDFYSGTEWKVTNNEQFEKWFQSGWKEKVVYLGVEVVTKKGYKTAESYVDRVESTTQVVTSVLSVDLGVPSIAEGSVISAKPTGQSIARCGVINSDSIDICSPVQMTNEEDTGDTCNHAPNVEDSAALVDWSKLAIILDGLDGDAHALLDEDELFDAMGFKNTDERAAATAIQEEAALPVIPIEIQQDMIDAAIVVSDEVPADPELVWDRDDPPMEVGTKYPSMNEFRMAVKQHAIVSEFELETEKSDPDRFRGKCSANGCPWKIRAKTQADKSVRVLY